jgi:hypothetical protein
LEQGTGAKAGVSMTNKISYSDGPMGEVKVVDDFLPPPEELAFREETVKVTIALSKASVEFFSNSKFELRSKNGCLITRKMLRSRDEYLERGSYS